ncbi:MAG: antibiotic biosynthesis monooxygenase [Actinomycetales bacterium]|nr:antibiotic biosynthesis monooxygenase [Actinomycetales bacterium]
MAGPGFVVLYRWRIAPGRERQFAEAWEEVTNALLARGSQGSRLHRGDDGLWYAYAQWPSQDARRRAFDRPSEHADASARMHEAVAEYLPEVILEVVADCLVA